MGSSPQPKAGRFRVLVSRDRLQAWIEISGTRQVGQEPPTEAEIIGALSDKGVAITDDVRTRVAECVKLLATRQQAGTAPAAEGPRRFLVAQGRPAVEAKNGEFEWDEAFDARMRDWQSDAPVNYYTMNSILTLEAGTRVGRITPPTDGQPGLDVYGKPIPPLRKKGLPLRLGSGLCPVQGDPQWVCTTAPGHLAREGNTLYIKPLVSVTGDVDFRSGNIDSVVDVHVSGGIKPNFRVRTSGSLTVQRAVEAASLDVGGDIQVRGGLFGQESGHLIRAGGSITASICDNADVVCGGDLNITREIVNSRVRVEGLLRIERGSIVGGEIYARNGVKVKDAGSDVAVTTRIAVGIHGAVLYRAQLLDQQVRKQQEQAEQIRTRIQPLLANLKRLTAAQREQATELMAKADEIELAAEALVAERNQILEAAKPSCKPGIEVTGTLFPGVVLVFGLREARIRTPIKGPVRVEERLVNNVTEIVVVNQLTGSVIPLRSGPVDPQRFRTGKPTAGESHEVEQTQGAGGAGPGHDRQ